MGNHARVHRERLLFPGYTNIYLVLKVTHGCKNGITFYKQPQVTMTSPVKHMSTRQFVNSRRKTAYSGRVMYIPSFREKLRLESREALWKACLPGCGAGFNT